LDPARILPERTYAKAELLVILNQDRQKCRLTLEGLSEEKTRSLCKFSLGQVSFGELLLDNMRHVQEHAAQLNMFQGQQTGALVKWVSRTK
jgi:hypothetical protein